MSDDKKNVSRRRGRPDPRVPADPWHPSRPIGLARALLKAGYATRRQAEQLVEEGRVRVGDEVVTDPRHMVGTDASIYLDGAHLERIEMRYFAIHKPLRMVCDESEGPGRRQLAEVLPTDIPGLAPAGRMDAKTSGLILVSNDTEWLNLITTTKGLEQEYRVQVDGDLTEMEINVMGAGIHVPGGGVFKPQTVRVVESLNGRTVVNICVRDGKVRQLRRMLETLRHKVTAVRRVRIGDIRLGGLASGALRELSSPEVASVREIHLALKRRNAPPRS